MHPNIHLFAACGTICGLTPARFYRLIEKYSDIAALWNLSVEDIVQAGIVQEAAIKIVSGLKNCNPVSYYKNICNAGIKAVCIEEYNYPALLKEISHPPFVLYYRGTLPGKASEILGVVGTRAVTHYGVQITPGVVSELVQNGFSIASGLARGIDTLVHRACLDRGGIAIAVLGQGVDDECIYPAQNRTLAHEIIQGGGCVISEYPPGTQVQAYHFPARNRIISGISRGVIVIEAAERSGALITARHALEQNREVFAVPGPIYNPMSAGPHSLIKQGAIPLTSPADICDYYDHIIDTGLKQKKILGANESECELLKYLSSEPKTIDELCRMCNLDTKIVASTLMVMEMKRMVRNIGAMKYVVN